MLNFNFFYWLSEQNKVEVGTQNKSMLLVEDAKEPDEVVGNWLRYSKRRDLVVGGSICPGEKLAANWFSNVAQALQGQLPGVCDISGWSSGSYHVIRVRGGGSITQSNDPLFIVDGVQGVVFDDIPADNIESIDRLKDAASTVIYGARGANGVILVTTNG